MSMPRTAEIRRETGETQISLSLDIDGAGKSQVATGIGFFDHVLTLFAKHGLLDLTIEAKGDLEVDYHHTVEDVGIVLGEAVAQAVGDKAGIRRYGHAYVPMDEALVRSVIDCSGRPFLVFDAPARVEPIGLFPFQLVEEFLRAFAVNAAANVHVAILYGKDAHHMAEGVFKSLGRALDAATTLDDRVQGVPSTKGLL